MMERHHPEGPDGSDLRSVTHQCCRFPKGMSPALLSHSDLPNLPNLPLVGCLFF
jgi:hypothetical protein